MQYALCLWEEIQSKNSWHYNFMIVCSSLEIEVGTFSALFENQKGNWNVDFSLIYKVLLCCSLFQKSFKCEIADNLLEM